MTTRGERQVAAATRLRMLEVGCSVVVLEAAGGVIRVAVGDSATRADLEAARAVAAEITERFGIRIEVIGD
jgi:hypothetical protein